MSLFPQSQASIDFPQPLSEKYRPKLIADFIGLEKQRKVASAFVRAPREAAFLFCGTSGVGKTTLALAMAQEMGAELHLIPSQKCTVENLEDTLRHCAYVPLSGGFHFVLVDEIDTASNAAQLALLSKLDSTARPSKTVFCFTCNSSEKLERRFLSRCLTLEFSSYGLRTEVAAFLERVWDVEIGHSGNVADAKRPDFERIVKNANNNIRDSLSVLEIEILAA